MGRNTESVYHLFFACEWTRPTVPWSEGTFEVRRSCLHSVTSQISAFSICSHVYARLAALTATLKRAWAVASMAVPCASRSICATAAQAQAAFYQGAAFGWKGSDLRSVVSLVSCMSLTRSPATSSGPSYVGVGGGGVGLQVVCGGRWRKARIRSYFFSRSIMKPGTVSSGVGLCRWPRTLAASLYDARLIVESSSCPAPLRVISPGLFGRVSRLVAAHPSMRARDI